MNPVLLLSQIILLYYYLEISQKCIASSTNWNRFVTSRNYSNLRLTTTLNYFIPHYLPKNVPAITAKMHCSLACAHNQSCHAFNFYETDTSYVCELLADNYCVNLGTVGFTTLPGSTIWDKMLNASLKLTCLDARFAAGQTIACEVMRPGCLGNWPSCSNCPRSCIDCNARKLANCTFWPEGNGALTPITGHCYSDQTFLVDRSVDLNTGIVSEDYQMSFQDMRRTLASKAYTQLQFWFGYSNTGWYYSTYLNASIFDNGTWESMRFFDQPSPYPKYTPAGDVLSLNGSAPLKTMPFVTVTDDRYGCGSFWLLDPNNATYCPGGNTSMWGTPKMSGGKAIYGGIRFPGAPSGTIFKYTQIILGDVLA